MIFFSRTFKTIVPGCKSFFSLLLLLSHRISFWAIEREAKKDILAWQITAMRIVGKKHSECCPCRHILRREMWRGMFVYLFLLNRFMSLSNHLCHNNQLYDQLPLSWEVKECIFFIFRIFFFVWTFDWNLIVYWKFQLLRIISSHVNWQPNWSQS